MNHPLMFISNVTPSVQANILADLDDHNNLMTLLYPLLPSNNLSLYQAEKFYSNAYHFPSPTLSLSLSLPPSFSLSLSKCAFIVTLR